MTFKQVTKADFYSEIFDKKLDVTPKPERDVVYWEFGRTRKLFGKSYPGYKDSGYPNIEKKYFIAID